MNMKVLIIFLLIFFDISNITGQTEEQNHAKYWYYRDRLYNNFMIPTEEVWNGKKWNDIEDNHSNDGTSLVACVRNTGYIHPLYQYGSGGLNNLYFADQTIDLGWYIGILATEYFLLNEYEQNTVEILTELYFAFKAYKRLDESEDHGGFNNNNLNYDGLFVREDVPMGFIDNNVFYRNLLNKDTPERIFFLENQENKLGRADFVIENNNIKRIMSQDQIIHLMMGFALVKKCLKNKYYRVYDKNGVFIENFHFVNKSKEIVIKMICYLQNLNNDDDVNSWTIYDPDGRENGTGSVSWLMAVGFQMAGKKITNYNFIENDYFDMPFPAWLNFNFLGFNLYTIFQASRFEFAKWMWNTWVPLQDELPTFLTDIYNHTIIIILWQLR